MKSLLMQLFSFSLIIIIIVIITIGFPILVLFIWLHFQFIIYDSLLFYYGYIYFPSFYIYFLF